VLAVVRHAVIMALVLGSNGGLRSSEGLDPWVVDAVIMSWTLLRVPLFSARMGMGPCLSHGSALLA
jgi:hypothetical protein